MTPTRRLALASGVLYLLTFAFSIPAYFLYEPVLTDPAYIVSTGGADTRIALGAVLALLTWELSVGPWMIFMGFNASALATLGFDEGEAEPPSASRTVVADGVS